MTGTNRAGNVAYGASTLRSPASVEELADIVAPSAQDPRARQPPLVQPHRGHRLGVPRTDAAADRVRPTTPYPRLEELRALAVRLDPERRLANPLTTRWLGR